MGETFQKKHISNLSIRTWQNLCKKLDLTIFGVGNNFIDLAHHVGMTLADLEKIRDGEEPTHSVLIWWAQKSNATISDLKEILKKMGREDCLEILFQDRYFANLVDSTQDEKMKETFQMKHISDLSIRTWQMICKKLDLKIFGVGNNFVDLAHHVGMTLADLEKIREGEEPTHSVLNWWAQKSNAAIPNLMKILKKMGREDCLEILFKDPSFANSDLSMDVQM